MIYFHISGTDHLVKTNRTVKVSGMTNFNRTNCVICDNHLKW